MPINWNHDLALTFLELYKSHVPARNTTSRVDLGLCKMVPSINVEARFHLTYVCLGTQNLVIRQEEFFL